MMKLNRKIVVFLVTVLLLISISYGVHGNENNKVLISLMGDVMMDRGVGSLIDIHGPDYPWEGVRDTLRKSDISLLNLETSIGSANIPIEDKEYVFQSKPESIVGLINASIDGVSIANNHSMDYGKEGFLETIINLEKNGIKYSGGGRTIEEALKPAIWDVNGIKVGFLAFSRVIPQMSWYATDKTPGIASGYDYYAESVAACVTQVKEQVDFLIVSTHWGKELAEHPQESDMKFAKLLIDNGADVIMGHHPHVLQGIEIYNNKPIIYSLGNFVFNSRGFKSNSTMITNIEINKQGIIHMKIIPVEIKHGQPSIAEGHAKEEIIQRMNDLSRRWGTTITRDGEIQGEIQYATGYQQIENNNRVDEFIIHEIPTDNEKIKESRFIRFINKFIKAPIRVILKRINWKTK